MEVMQAAPQCAPQALEILQAGIVGQDDPSGGDHAIGMKADVGAVELLGHQGRGPGLKQQSQHFAAVDNAIDGRPRKCVAGSWRTVPRALSPTKFDFGVANLERRRRQRRAAKRYPGP